MATTDLVVSCFCLHALRTDRVYITADIFFSLKAVVLNLCKHAEPLRRYPSFCRTPFLPNVTENKNGLLKLTHSTVYI